MWGLDVLVIDLHLPRPTPYTLTLTPNTQTHTLHPTPWRTSRVKTCVQHKQLLRQRGGLCCVWQRWGGACLDVLVLDLHLPEGLLRLLVEPFRLPMRGYSQREGGC